jgi:hypothetical protein
LSLPWVSPVGYSACEEKRKPRPGLSKQFSGQFEEYFTTGGDYFAFGVEEGRISRKTGHAASARDTRGADRE